MNKKEVFKKIKEGKFSLSHHKELSDDKEIVLKLLDDPKNYKEMEFVSLKLKRNKIFLKEALTRNINAYQFLGDLQENNEVKKIISGIIGYSWRLSREPLSPYMRKCKPFFSIIIHYDVRYLSDADQEVKEDYQIAKIASSLRGFHLHYVGKSLRDNEEIVIKALNDCPEDLVDVSDRLKKEPKILNMVADKNGVTALSNAPIEMKNDKKFVIRCLKSNGEALYYASDELKNDKDAVIAAIKQSSNALRLASPLRQNDKEVVLKAVRQYGNSLRYASDELKGDKDVVLAAIQQNGMALQWASEKLKDNEEIVKQALSENYKVINYISERLKYDFNIFKLLVNSQDLAFTKSFVTKLSDSKKLRTLLESTISSIPYQEMLEFMRHEVKIINIKDPYYFVKSKKELQQLFATKDESLRALLNVRKNEFIAKIEELELANYCAKNLEL